MTDLEIMQRAKMYMDKLANGINPLDDSTLSENDIVNNVRISRCLFYVSDILRQVIEKGGTVTKKRTPQEDFNISFEDIQKFPFSDTPVTVSEIAKRINAINPNENMKKISYKHITDWLISVGMLRSEETSEGKTVKRPTESGSNLGIATELRNGMRGDYTVVVYNRNAQQFIMDNMDSIIDMMRG